MFNKNKWKYIFTEFVHHLPFSIFGVIGSIIVMGFLTFIAIIAQAESLLPEASREIFHVFHPAHVLFSAVASTSMYFMHERNIFKASVIGLIFSITICGISDIVFPFIGGMLLGGDMHMHICIIEEPMLVFPFAIIGVLAGLTAPSSLENSTQYSHSIHVFLSSGASLLYLIGFGVTGWIHLLGGIFLITVFAVMLPCCLSDIVFPLACCKNPNHKHHC
jgi:hypothetical protein